MRVILVAALLLILHVPALAGSSAPPTTGGAAEPAVSSSRKLDVNRASAADLVSIPGIGERLAQAIIELREKKGSFTKLDELLEVRGIGEKNLAIFVEHLTVAQVAPPPAPGVAAKTK